MKSNVIAAINKYNMIKENDTIVVGVSGGADSMALLHFLLNESDNLKIKVIVAHINHCLRGEESDRDEKFVSDYCRDNGVIFYSCRSNIKSEASEYGISVEECGRKVRYNYFNNIAEKYHAKIATAHTLSDSIETTMFNMIRGTGIKGLSGIAPVRGKIIRPLIFVTRSQIEDYCVKNKIKYVIDSSNLCYDYTRNKIRLDIVPKMREINTAFEKSFLRLKEQVEDDCSYLNNIAKSELDKSMINGMYDINVISKLEKPIKSRLIIQAVYNKFNIYLQNSHIDLICEIIDNGHGTVTIPGKIYVKVENGFLRIYKDAPEIKNWKNKFNEGKILTDSGRKFIIEIITKNEYLSLKKTDKNLIYKCLDYDKITENTIIRNRKPGDKFTQKNRKVRKSLKKLFNEKKVPIEKRNELAIIDDGDEILWIEGIGPSEKAAVSENTKKVVLIVIGECLYGKGN